MLSLFVADFLVRFTLLCASTRTALALPPSVSSHLLFPPDSFPMSSRELETRSCLECFVAVTHRRRHGTFMPSFLRRQGTHRCAPNQEHGASLERTAMAHLLQLPLVLSVLPLHLYGAPLLSQPRFYSLMANSKDGDLDKDERMVFAFQRQRHTRNAVPRQRYALTKKAF